jgi:hypothetical protein
MSRERIWLTVSLSFALAVYTLYAWNRWWGFQWAGLILGTAVIGISIVMLPGKSSGKGGSKISENPRLALLMGIGYTAFAVGNLMSLLRTHRYERALWACAWAMLAATWIYRFSREKAANEPELTILNLGEPESNHD